MTTLRSLKMRNKRNVTDYITQVRFISQSDTLQVMPYLYGPSFEETPDNQEEGLGFRTEYALNPSNSIGVLAQFGDTPALSRTLGEGFVRLSQASWNGFMSDYVFEYFNVHSDPNATVGQWTWYNELYVDVPEWVETGWVYEYLHATDPAHEVSFQTGPRVNIRLNGWFSLLGDARNISTNGLSDWMYYGQAFLHLQI